MQFQELAVLLPCHSLEDFPQHHEGEEAEGLLACWTALWHPILLAAANSAPAWYRVDDPPEDVASKLLVVPAVSSSELPTGYAQRVTDAGACLIRREHNRSQIIAQALAELDDPLPTVDEEITADFLALGYCYLQIQLLTRQMRYSSNLDEVHFFDQLLAGARAAVDGSADAAREKLTACFDLLAEERDHYYSVDAYLLDLTLVAPTTLGESLRTELAATEPINVLLSGELLAAMEKQEPQTLTLLRQRLDEQRAGILGGEFRERHVPLLGCESVLSELRRGAAHYEATLGRNVDVFGRWRFGLTATLPQILDKMGFQGVLHAALDEGRCPLGTQVKTRWEGTDGSAVDALAKAPLDASKPETFLGLAGKLGESMDMDHVATLCLAHWPGHASDWYQDLRRAARYGASLGKFVTVQEYFRDTYMPGHLERFDADQYQSPYLKQSVIRGQADAISSVVRYWRNRAKADAIESLDMLADVITGRAKQTDARSESESGAVSGAGEIQSPARTDRDEDIDGGDASPQLESDHQAAARRFADALPRNGGAVEAGYLVVNALSFARRVSVPGVQLACLPDLDRPVYAADTTSSGQDVIVDIPPLGFAWVTAGSQSQRPRQKESPPLAEDLTARDGLVVVRNEFFEALINPATGALQSLKDYHSRGNRLSQQLAFRLPSLKPAAGEAWRDPDEYAVYSVMRADKVAVTVANRAVGEVTAVGKLLDANGEQLADYRQVFRTIRGSRVLQIDVQLEPHREPTSDAWNSYYGCRFAWADETAELRRSLHHTRQPATKRRLEAPECVEIVTGETRTTVLTGGLPYHRRVGFRVLDSLLIVRGERERCFRLGIGVDLPNPIQGAAGLLAPPVTIGQTAGAPSPASSGWLFHIDSRSVVATHWEALVERETVMGFRVRLLETTGRPGRAKLSCFQPVATARRVDFRNQPLADCQIDDGRVVLDLTGHEWTEVEGRWHEASSEE